MLVTDDDDVEEAFASQGYLDLSDERRSRSVGHVEGVRFVGTPDKGGAVGGCTGQGDQRQGHKGKVGEIGPNGHLLILQETILVHHQQCPKCRYPGVSNYSRFFRRSHHHFYRHGRLIIFNDEAA